MSNKDFLVNDAIRARQVRLVDDGGKQIGVFMTKDAIERARRSGLDLIQVSNSEPPACRILDAGKYIFDQKRHKREAMRRQRELTVEVKEIQLRPVTDTNDLMVKSRKAQGFLGEGDKVKIVVRFRGRERAHKEVGRKVVAEFLTMMGEHKIERELADTGKDLQMILAPVKSKADLVRDRSSN